MLSSFILSFTETQKHIFVFCSICLTDESSPMKRKHMEFDEAVEWLKLLFYRENKIQYKIYVIKN